MLSRTQLVRGMHYSIISVIYYVSTQLFRCYVMSDSTTCPFLVQKGNISLRITHRLVQQISSAVFKLQQYVCQGLK